MASDIKQVNSNEAQYSFIFIFLFRFIISPSRLKFLKKQESNFFAVWGRLGWTEANQLPGEPKVTDWENGREAQ